MPRNACKGGDLDEALQGIKRLFVVSGALGSKAEEVIDEAAKMIDPAFEHALLICDVKILKIPENQSWFQNNASVYAVLAEDDRTAPCGTGTVDSLLDAHGKPSWAKISAAMEGNGV